MCMKPYKILFVCLGNICRSPAGENVMRDLLMKEKAAGILCDSAGTAGYHIGKRPDHRMIQELERRGVNVSGTAQKFEKKHFQEYDLIVPMDDDNQRKILKLAKTDEDRAKVLPFMSFCNKFSDPVVPDPYYGGDEGFSHVVDLMEDGCRGILSHALKSMA